MSVPCKRDTKAQPRRGHPGLTASLLRFMASNPIQWKGQIRLIDSGAPPGSLRDSQENFRLVEAIGSVDKCVLGTER